MGLRDSLARFISGNGNPGVSPATGGNNPMSLADSNAQGGKVVPDAWANTVFGPGLPITPWQGQQKEPRDFDYLMAANATLVPRASYDLMLFTELRQIYKTIPEVRLAIHSLIREVSVYKPTLTDQGGDEVDEPELRWLIESPDRHNPWNVWLVKFLKNVLIYDAAAVYIERGAHGYHKYSKLVRDSYESWKGTYGEVAADNLDARAAYDRYLKGSVDHAFSGMYGIGEPSALRVINGATLFVLIDEDGNTPEPPAPAYTQIVQGAPFLFLSSRELWYRPMFPDLESPYGTTGIEECLPWITIIANMLGYRIAHYREGTMPEAFYTAPEGWSADQVTEWQIKRATRLAGSMAERSREQYMPFGFANLATKQVEWNKEEYEQARDNVLYTFGMLPSDLGITKGEGLGGGGYLSEMDKASHQLGPGPLIKFVEGFFEFVLGELGRDDLNFALKSPSAEGDPAKTREETVKLFQTGMLTVNQVLEALDKEPIDKNGELGGNKRFLIQGANLWAFDEILAGKDTTPIPPLGGATAAPGSPGGALGGPPSPNGGLPAASVAGHPTASNGAPTVVAVSGNGHVDPLAAWHSEQMATPEEPHTDPLEGYHKVADDEVDEDSFLDKHMPGKHNQMRHSWRYGVGYDKLKAQLKKMPKSEREEYKARARAKGHGSGPGEKPTGSVKAAGTGTVAGKGDARHEQATKAFMGWPPPKLGEDFSNASVSAAKAKIVSGMTEETELPYESVNRGIHQWANSSNDTAYASLHMQERAATVFESSEMSKWQKGRLEQVIVDRKEGIANKHYGAKPSEHSVFENKFGKATPGVAGKFKSADEATDHFLTTMHQRTQAQLKQAGVTHVVVYRGVKLSRADAERLGINAGSVGKVQKIKGNALESWTAQHVTAQDFAHTYTGELRVGVIYKMKVPISRVVGTARTGFGCLNEWEYVLTGGKGGDKAQIVSINP